MLIVKLFFSSLISCLYHAFTYQAYAVWCIMWNILLFADSFWAALSVNFCCLATFYLVLLGCPFVCLFICSLYIYIYIDVYICGPTLDIFFFLFTFLRNLRTICSSLFLKERERGKRKSNRSVPHQDMVEPTLSAHFLCGVKGAL